MLQRFSYKFQSQVNVAWLLLAITGVSAVGWMMHSVYPDSPVTISFFFVLIAITVFSGLYYLTNDTRRSILLCCGVLIFLFLRLIGLRDTYYVALLGGCIFSLELYFQKR